MCNSTWNGKFVSVIDASLLIFPSGSHVESIRIHKYASCSNECYVLALIYIDRLIQRNNFLLTNLNVHRVVITAILLAAKFFDDAYYNNAYYAKIGGVLVSEMNGLEVDFLFRINFSLHVTPEEYKEAKPDPIMAFGSHIAQHMNEDHMSATIAIAEAAVPGLAGDNYVKEAMISRVDSLGMDIKITRDKDNNERLPGQPEQFKIRVGFPSRIEDRAGVKVAIMEMTNAAAEKAKSEA